MRTLKQTLYGNFLIQSPDGFPMFRCNQDKLDWYLQRGLVAKVEGETYQFTFEPNGWGCRNDPYSLSEKENKCTVCGSAVELTKHHCVPIAYRRNFPDCIKSHNSHDVVLLCGDCHIKYEKEADKLREAIAEETGIALNIPKKVDLKTKKARNIAHTLLTYGQQIPQDRKQYLMEWLSENLGRAVGQEELEAISKTEDVAIDKNHKSHGELVAKTITDYGAFVERWRRHFVETMQPKFLPAYWDINRPAERLK